MKDYYTLFVELCEQTNSTEDYADKTKVRTHNRAMKQLLDLQKEMLEEPDRCETILLELIAHESEKVRLNAAAFGYRNYVCDKKSAIVLLHLKKCAKDKTLSFNAGMTLKYGRKEA